MAGEFFTSRINHFCVHKRKSIGECLTVSYIYRRIALNNTKLTFNMASRCLITEISVYQQVLPDSPHSPACALSQSVGPAHRDTQPISTWQNAALSADRFTNSSPFSCCLLCIYNTVQCAACVRCRASSVLLQGLSSLPPGRRITPSGGLNPGQRRRLPGDYLNSVEFDTMFILKVFCCLLLTDQLVGGKRIKAAKTGTWVSGHLEMISQKRVASVHRGWGVFFNVCQPFEHLKKDICISIKWSTVPHL